MQKLKVVQLNDYHIIIDTRLMGVNMSLISCYHLAV